MDFDPDNHDSQPIVSSRPRRRLFSPVGTAIIVLLALAGWLISGIIFNSEKVEAAKPIKTSNEISEKIQYIHQHVLWSR